MLVLSRKLGEKIFIGDNICITVVDIDRGKIRLGIEAPRDVSDLPSGAIAGQTGRLPRGSSSSGNNLIPTNLLVQPITC